MEQKLLSQEAYPAALALAWRVFMQFEATEYEKSGVDAFAAAIHDPAFIAGLRIYGAYDADALVGILATRSGGSHIALFFVDERYHRQGVGGALFALAAADCPGDRMTVHSSPYAVEVYRHLGFRPTAEEQVEDGIRYTPMECMLKDPDCPCKRSACRRHGQCAACRAHHKMKNLPVFCEREEDRPRQRRSRERNR